AEGHEEHIFGFEKGHDAVLRLANKYSLGIAVIRSPKAVGTGLELVFVVRQTKDLTIPNNPSGYPYVKFSPKNDTFAGIDEMYSLVDWVDVVLVHAPKKFATDPSDILYGAWPMSYPDK